LDGQITVELINSCGSFFKESFANFKMLCKI